MSQSTFCDEMSPDSKHVPISFMVGNGLHMCLLSLQPYAIFQSMYAAGIKNIAPITPKAKPYILPSEHITYKIKTFEILPYFLKNLNHGKLRALKIMTTQLMKNLISLSHNAMIKKDVLNLFCSKKYRQEMCTFYIYVLTNC